MLSRRTFGVQASLALGSLYLTTHISSVWASSPVAQLLKREKFLTAIERAFVEAAVERLIPSDDLGPGGRGAGVAEFIDAQLAGPFGRAERWYMTGPWQDGTPQQGYQLKETPAEVYRSAIRQISEQCHSRFNGHAFSELSASEQDGVLKEVEAGDFGVDNSKTFFDILLRNSREGFFSDPMYGGNRDFVGWKLIGFPGARYNYSSYIEKHGQRFPYPPVGILGRKLPSGGKL